MSAIADTKTGLTIKNQVKNGKKRKRIKQSPREQFQIERADRYKKLHHAISKHFHRDAKVVKSFECQKIVRAIKVANESVGARTQHEDDGDIERKDGKKLAKATKRLETLQQKLDRTKKLDMEVLVKVGLKRLGVSSLDPEASEDANASDEKAQTTSGDIADSKVLSQIEDPFYQTLIESMLQHKRLSTALDQLNEKVTEYRQWTLHREAILRGERNPEGNNRGKRKKNIEQQQGRSVSGNDTMVVAGGFNSRSKRGLDLGGHEGDSGLFIGSLSGMQAVEYNEGGEITDEDGEGYVNVQEEKKKNRPGQRARKAKAMAIEARKAGKTWDASTNWREEKKGRSENKYDERQISAHVGEEGGYNHKSRGNNPRRNKDDGGAKPKEAQDIATTGKTWKEEGNAHPSWAAAAAKKAQGVAEFKGTKITFD